jgi:hypothetical protein
MRKIVFGLLFLFIALPVWAKDLYVDVGSIGGAKSDTYTRTTNSITQPFATLARAFAVMSAGDDIWLRNGTYNEHDLMITIAGTSGDYCSLRSYPGEWAKIDGQRLSTPGPMYGNAVISNAQQNNLDNPNEVPGYWIFERLEITGGGCPIGSGDYMGHGLFLSFGPFQVRYCYIHDNIGSWGDENPAGLGGACWHDVVIEYNYFKDNGADNYTANVFQITNMTGVEYGYGVSLDTTVYRNQIRYNYITGKSGGIRTKGVAWLPSDRTGATTTYQEYGDDIHHNVIIQSLVGGETWIPAIIYQQDYVQIHNNIIDQSATPKCDANNMYNNWSINTRRLGTPGRDTIWGTIYNNTVYGGACELGDLHEGAANNTGLGGTGTVPSRIWIYNNILDNHGGIWGPITYGCTSGYCDGYANFSALSETNINIDRNYLYRPPGGDTRAVHIGNRAYTLGNYTIAQWESAHSGLDLFTQSTQESGANKLYVGTTGADKYRTVGTHVMEGSDTIANRGIGGSHPYKSGITLPSYVGATNPSDDDWVAGVLALDVTYFTSATAGSTPTWVEGSEAEPAATSSLTNGAVRGGLH